MDIETIKKLIVKIKKELPSHRIADELNISLQTVLYWKKKGVSELNKYLNLEENHLRNKKQLIEESKRHEQYRKHRQAQFKELASKPFEPYGWVKLLQKLYSEYESEEVIGERPIKGLTMEYIDKCDGEKFDRIIGDYLENQDFNIEYTKRSGDFGVDIIAKRNDIKIAVQIKRYSTLVSRHAVSDVVAGSKYYSCNKTMVVTNNYFTKSAIELAGKTDTGLIDRDKLIEWLE